MHWSAWVYLVSSWLITVYSAAPFAGVPAQSALFFKDLIKDPAAHVGGEEFLRRLEKETDAETRSYALAVYKGIIEQGAYTEIGAHGNNLSWKWLGVAREKEAGQYKYAVIGYANSQFFPAPYNDIKQNENFIEVPVGTLIKGDTRGFFESSYTRPEEILVVGQKINELPPETQSKIKKALEIATGMKVDRIVDAGRDILDNPQVFTDLKPAAPNSLDISLSGGNGLALWSTNTIDLKNLSLAPGQTVIIGRKVPGRPKGLDNKYGGIYLEGTSAQNDKTNSISRGQCSLHRDNTGHLFLETGFKNEAGTAVYPPVKTLIKESGKKERELPPGEKYWIRKGDSIEVIFPDKETRFTIQNKS